MPIKRTAIIFAIIGWILLISPVFFANAANIANLYDSLSSVATDSFANHTLTFSTPSGVGAVGDQIEANFGSTTSNYHFDISAISSSDISLSVDNDSLCDGPWTAKNIGALPDTDLWGADIDPGNRKITLSAPTNTVAGEIPAGSCVEIKIGNHLTGGLNQIKNPNLSDGIQVGIGGSFGDTGLISVLIMNNNSVNVSAVVDESTFPATSTPVLPNQTGGGGGYQDITPPVVMSFEILGLDQNSATVKWQTNEPVSCLLSYGKTSSYEANTMIRGSFSSECQFNLAGLATATNYLFRAISVDRAGNQTVTNSNFSTLLDVTAPTIPQLYQIENVEDFKLMPSAKDIRLTWTRPGIAASRNILILRSDRFFPTGRSNGEVVYFGHEPESANGIYSYVDNKNLAPDTIYYYNLISSDMAGHESSGALAYASLTADPQRPDIPVVVTTSTATTPPPPPASQPDIPTPGTLPKVDEIHDGGAELSFADFDFIINSTQKIEPNNDEVKILDNDRLIISLKKNKVGSTTERLILNLVTDQGPRLINLKLDQEGGFYYANLPELGPGKYPLIVGLYNSRYEITRIISGELNVSLEAVANTDNTQKADDDRGYLGAVFILLLSLLIYYISDKIARKLIYSK